MKKTTILFLALLLALLFVSCEEAQTPFYAVTFNMNGYGKQIDLQIVDKGKTATAPTNVTSAEANFEGWFTDKDCTEAFDFKTPIYSNITLYAKWKGKTDAEKFIGTWFARTPGDADYDVDVDGDETVDYLVNVPDFLYTLTFTETTLIRERTAREYEILDPNTSEPITNIPAEDMAFIEANYLNRFKEDECPIELIDPENHEFKFTSEAVGLETFDYYFVHDGLLYFPFSWSDYFWKGEAAL